MPIGTRVFTGMMPKAASRQLEPQQASLARDCWLDRRIVRPMPNPRRVEGLPLFADDVQAIWRFDETRWFQWSADVDVVRAPVREDVVNRVIWTGDGPPRQTTEPIMQGGNFASPGTPISRTLGIPAPTQTPSAAFHSGDAEADFDSDLKESHAYVYTFLSDLDEEGPPSPPSAILDRGFDDDGNIRRTIVTMPTAVQGDHGVNRKRIYRTATAISDAGTSTSFRFLATVPLTQPTFTDSTLTARLGDALLSTFWDPPPANLEGLIALPNGVLAGFLGRDVYFSEPYQPHAWPTDYIHTVEDPIVGLGSFGTSVVICTTGTPWLVSGSHPGSASQAKMEFNQSCVAKRSIYYVDLQGVAFASPDGLVVVGPGGGQLVTKELYERADWQALNPEQFRAVYHDGAYVAFSDTAGIAFDPTIGGAVETTDAGVKAVFHDRERDTIYVIGADRMLYEWDTDYVGAETRRSCMWRSRVEVGPLRTYSAAQVIADEHSSHRVRLRLYASTGGPLTQVYVNDQVASPRPFRLPPLDLASHWQYEVETLTPVREVRIGAMRDMA